MESERTSLEDLVAAYFARYVALREKRSAVVDELSWASERVDDLVRESPSEGWALTHELLRSAPDDEALMYVAAGPLEDLLTGDGERVIDEVITAARRDAKIRRALGGVWGRTRMAPRVVAAIERILGPVT